MPCQFFKDIDFFFEAISNFLKQVITLQSCNFVLFLRDGAHIAAKETRKHVTFKLIENKIC